MKTLELPALLGGPPSFPNGPPGWPVYRTDVGELLQQCWREGSWGKYDGPYTRQLESVLGRFHEVEHVILCCSGTAAVELALRGLGIGPGDEVILAGYDFKGNFTDILTVGALPVLVDIGENSLLPAMDKVAEVLSSATKALLLSHLHGSLAPMPAWRDFAKNLGVALIEDACQVPGARIAGQPAGSWGDVGVLSFGGSKLLTAGRGGAILTRSAEIAQRVRLYCQRGNWAYPLSELQAAALLPQMSTLDDENKRRRANAVHLDALLANTNQEILRIPSDRHSTDNDGDANQQYHTTFYKLPYYFAPESARGLHREQFVTALRSEGVAIDVGFRALHRIHARRRFRANHDLPHAQRADEQLVVLHHPVLLGTFADMETIARAIGKIARYSQEILETFIQREFIAKETLKSLHVSSYPEE